MRLNPVLLTLLLVGAVHASEDDAGKPLWELGVGAFGASQLAYPGADQSVNRALVLPFGLYRGQWLRADGETTGVRAVKTQTLELDVGVAASFGASSDKIEARRGMADLGTLIEFGPLLKVNLGRDANARWRLDVPLRAVLDLSDRGRHRGFSFEPEINWESRQGGNATAVSLGVLMADRRLASTFYSVNAAEATALRPAYAARAGLVSVRLSASQSFKLGRDWQIFGFARLESVSGAANTASPLVRRSQGVTYGLGLTYTFARSSEKAKN
jgi:MipA family protein